MFFSLPYVRVYYFKGSSSIRSISLCGYWKHIFLECHPGAIEASERSIDKGLSLSLSVQGCVRPGQKRRDCVVDTFFVCQSKTAFAISRMST